MKNSKLYIKMFIVLNIALVIGLAQATSYTTILSQTRQLLLWPTKFGGTNVTGAQVFNVLKDKVFPPGLSITSRLKDDVIYAINQPIGTFKNLSPFSVEAERPLINLSIFSRIAPDYTTDISSDLVGLRFTALIFKDMTERVTAVGGNAKDFLSQSLPRVSTLWDEAANKGYLTGSDDIMKSAEDFYAVLARTSNRGMSRHLRIYLKDLGDLSSSDVGNFIKSVNALKDEMAQYIADDPNLAQRVLGSFHMNPASLIPGSKTMAENILKKLDLSKLTQLDDGFIDNLVRMAYLNPTTRGAPRVFHLNKVVRQAVRMSQNGNNQMLQKLMDASKDHDLVARSLERIVTVTR